MNPCRAIVLGLVTAALPAAADAGSAPGASEDGEVLLLAQAVFDGATPMPGRFLVALPGEDGWTTEVVADTAAGGNVFHKALAFQPKAGGPGVLTISANPAFVKLWRRGPAGWAGTTLWTGVVGDEQNRLRDAELGDVDGDGVDELVVVTHDRGKVLVFEETEDGRLEPTIVAEAAEGVTEWIHECELLDVDGDGKAEIFYTPSAPNNLSGKEQPGSIRMLRHGDDGFAMTELEEFRTRHVKELLAADHEGTPTLFAALEGEKIGGAGGASSAVKAYTFDGQDPRILGELPGSLCRFLTMGDTDGNGRPEIIASTMSHGILCLQADDSGEWTRRTIASSLVSSSFEHATVVFDRDGDGIDEVYVASDKQKRIHCFRFDADRDRYAREKLANIPGESVFTFGLTRAPRSVVGR